MQLLKLNVQHPQVIQARAWLSEQGFTALALTTLDVFDSRLESKTKEYQRARHLKDDGKIGQFTWGALEADHLRFLLASQSATDDGKLPTRPEWVQRFQRILNAWGSGLVGYGTPQDSRAKMLKRPIPKRLRADRFDEDEAIRAMAKFKTSHTCGGCSSMASRTLAGILGDAAHRAFTNQTGVKPPIALRDHRFRVVNDNIPDAMINGDQQWDAGDWRPTCRGYSTLFEHKGPLEWQELYEAMRGVPFAILHLKGGHVICAFWVDQAKGWWYTDPKTGLLLLDDCWVWAADGWSGAVGQPTTLQKDHDRLSKKDIDHLWCLMVPDGFDDGDSGLVPCLQE